MVLVYREVYSGLAFSIMGIIIVGCTKEKVYNKENCFVFLFRLIIE